ncbi:MAG: hypothetical protein KIS73_19575 [Enhydrobacter sp.]|nr:hypothetical protein [Enhydrobacter sp.]
MPDGMNIKPTQTLPALTSEERAHRLHALIVALYETQSEVIGLNLSTEEAENVRGNLHSMALDESRALIASNF